MVTEALRLFAEKGYDATTVDEIAAAAGISRRTFFRQFGAKEDVVFVDHDLLLADVEAYLAQPHEDPWQAVCEAAVLVFEGLSHWRDRRYAVVHVVPALRERELVTIFRYERAFVEFLRRLLPAEPDEAVVQFAAAVTATHNLLLRRMVRDGREITSEDVRAALATLRDRFAPPR